MSDRRHCDTCQAVQDSGWPPWISVGTDGGPNVGGGIHTLRGDFCSIECLARKMQAAVPDARDQMYAALNVTPEELRALRAYRSAAAKNEQHQGDDGKDHKDRPQHAVKVPDG